MKEWFKIQISELEDQLSKLEGNKSISNQIERAHLLGRIYSLKKVILQEIITKKNYKL